MQVGTAVNAALSLHHVEIHHNNKVVLSHARGGDFFEDISFAIYDAVLKEGDVAVDCGVNLGHHTRRMAQRCGPTGQVFSFEAAPAMMAQAKALNHDLTNIVWIDRAVSSRSGETLTFHFYPHEHGLSGLRPRSEGYVVETLEVTSVTIDEAVTAAPVLMKLDIEGAEYLALTGAARILAEYRPVIVFENGREQAALQYGYTKEDFLELFHRHGYNLYSVAGMPLTLSNWDDALMPWQFFAVHPASPKVGPVFAAVHTAVGALEFKLDGL